MRALVTGAAGFVGAHLVDRLLGDGHTVIGWARPGTDAGATRAGIEWHTVELLDPVAVAAALREAAAEQIYHLAGWAHVAKSWQHAFDTYQNNVLATHHLLEGVRLHAPDARVLVTCSGAIYAPQNRPLREDDPIAPASPYATSKLAQEMLAAQVCRDDGLHVLIARSFNHTGPGQDPSYVASGIARQVARIEAGLQEPVLRLGNLEPKRDLTDVRDVARAYVVMMQNAVAGRPYNVCSGRHLSIRELVDTFVARASTPVSIVQDASLFRPNDLPMLVGDHERLTADTGWRPEIALHQTVDDLLRYWRDRTRH